MISHTINRIFRLLIILKLSLLMNNSSYGQDRWFQIELSIFSNENVEDRETEYWTPEDTDLSYPNNSRRLSLLADSFLPEENINDKPNAEEPLSQDDISNMIRVDQLKNIKPRERNTDSDFKLIDFARDDFAQLSHDDSDFQQTNRTLERSSEHRLLFHGLWRQAVQQSSAAIPIYIEGGLNYGEDYELQGSVTIRFNDAEDRVVVDTHIWLVEYSIVKNTDTEWVLPEIPKSIKIDSPINPSSLTYFPNKVYLMKQSRQMRSNEFHYLDHPALGLVISVKPYDVPSSQAIKGHF